MGEIFQVLISNGHSLYDLKYTYTIAQIYMFYEKIKKIELDTERMTALTMTNCLVYATPANDVSESRIKNRNFQQFMDSLNWNSFAEKAERKTQPRAAADTLKRLLGGVGMIPVRNKEKK